MFGLTVIFGIILMTGMFFVVDWIISMNSEKSIYGSYLSEEFLDRVLPEFLKSAMIIPTDCSILSLKNGYISKTRSGTWYLSQLGRIKKSSKWVKKLEEKQIELILK